METVANKVTKLPKGFATGIAQSAECSRQYVEEVLKGKHDNRSTEKVERIKRIAIELEKALQTK